METDMTQFAVLAAMIPSHWTAIRMTPKGLLCRTLFGQYVVFAGQHAIPTRLTA
jgi:hypothetical protein